MSQKSDIVAYLKDGGFLTPLKALKLFDCLSLSQRMSEIRIDLVGTRWRLVERFEQVGRKRIKVFTLKKERGE